MGDRGRMGFTPVFSMLAIFFIGCAKPQHFRADIQSENAGDRILAIRKAGEAKDRKAVPLIVDRLDDEDDGVRFFAIIALERITGTRLGYDNSAPSSERNAAVERWREFVRRGGHLSKDESGVAVRGGAANGVEGGAAPH